MKMDFSWAEQEVSYEMRSYEMRTMNSPSPEYVNSDLVIWINSGWVSANSGCVSELNEEHLQGKLAWKDRHRDIDIYAEKMSTWAREDEEMILESGKLRRAARYVSDTCRPHEPSSPNVKRDLGSM
jgi:hypothetical protein